MRIRVLFSLVLTIAACSLAPQARGAAARSATPAVVPACANGALPAVINPGVEANASAPPVLGTERVTAPNATLTLAIAKDETSRELGLMCVLHLEPHVGMIFVFDRDARQEFWMKNTLIALDMVWVRADGRVDTVAANVPKSTRSTPDDAVARRSGYGRYVIELAAGDAAADGIVAGGQLTIPHAP